LADANGRATGASAHLAQRLPLQQAFPGNDSNSDSTILNNHLNLFAC